jgi:hypothetical protein
LIIIWFGAFDHVGQRTPFVALLSLCAAISSAVLRSDDRLLAAIACSLLAWRASFDVQKGAVKSLHAFEAALVGNWADPSILLSGQLSVTSCIF